MKNNDVQLVDFVESEFLGEQVDFFKKNTSLYIHRYFEST